MNLDTVLTDIRCGCGGLCDARELCPMRGNVEACDCGATSVVHSRGQVGCLHEPGCDGTGPHHGRHDCTKSGEPGAGCFATCETYA